MTFTDPLADLLTRIRNAGLAGLATTIAPASRQKRAVLEVLKKEKFIADFSEKNGAAGFPIFEITLAPGRRGMTLRRISKPGRRIYRQKKDLRPVLDGRGIAILSTPKGVLSHKEAIRQNVGGEIICEIF